MPGDAPRLKELIELLIELVSNLTDIIKRDRTPVTSSMSLKPGEIKMPLTVTMGDPSGTATYQEFNAEGQPVGPLGTIHYASDNEAVASVDASGLMSYHSAGTCNIVGADDGTADGLPASDALTVLPAPADTTPVSSTMTLTAGTPVGGARRSSPTGVSPAASRTTAPKFVGGKFVK